MASRLIDFFTVPWAMFVAAFLYYVGLTLSVIGGADLSDRWMAVAYLVPVAAYGLAMLFRALRAVSGLVLHSSHVPQVVRG